ncbi:MULTISPECIES: N-acetylmuramic acid 6-phosphate etherase [Kribbella]|uniref:N-acetylmuramic acid 6-phosphate etherase n=1 Tax=Kribbella pratensis TaxID=2512112 RepID=A0ABY2FBD4_9ACTN|nr:MULTISPECIES: N-acetylmuramic acid 6-phosphate etherase [Kribbella]TDW87819.1 N-acetylmuramic acid 6-phosphate etherase [Kribbella pratensis]TDW88986.1 N-acetylmuramic acid 6-phosphate etherase [Kribbella sp. VKM Ac-2566]
MTSPTEQRNPRTLAIDAVGTSEILQLLNNEDALVAGAVSAVIPELTKAVDAAVEAVRGGGRVHYFGAGTSGRLATLDAAELLPTFHVPDGLVVAHHAGGTEALLRAVENVEDSEEGGARDAAAVTGQDLVVGLAASGSTPYVAGALKAARAAGATTVLVTSNPDAPLAPLADVVIAADTGPEVIAGSTRLKAGTAQKMILNAFSTTLMIKLGRTWSNLMVDLVATNKKLRGRMLRILAEATGADDAACEAALAEADGELKPALVHLLTGTPIPAARAALEAAHGRVATALAELG